jgi:two-component sensor histidine kinase
MVDEALTGSFNLQTLLAIRTDIGAQATYDVLVQASNDYSGRLQAIEPLLLKGHDDTLLGELTDGADHPTPPPGMGDARPIDGRRRPARPACALREGASFCPHFDHANHRQPGNRPLLQQLDASLRQSLREIRTLSYLLHPPLLDEAGLSLALSSFVEGYVERSGIDVTLDVSKQIGRLSPTTELVLFRVVQEALTNISRHSQSATASIRLEQQRSIFTSQAILTIEDAGKGIPTSRLKNGSLDGENTGLSGVGLASMRERLAQVGGRLEIQSVPGHTRIRASVPIGLSSRMGA